MPMIPAMIFKTSSLRVCIPVPKPRLHLPQAKGLVLPHLGGVGWKNAGGRQKAHAARWRQSRTLEIGKAPPAFAILGRSGPKAVAENCGSMPERRRAAAVQNVCPSPARPDRVCRPHETPARFALPRFAFRLRPVAPAASRRRGAGGRAARPVHQAAHPGAARADGIARASLLGGRIPAKLSATRQGLGG
jgi:hypothetical protein